jgi:transposase InsO family protein
MVDSRLEPPYHPVISRAILGISNVCQSIGNVISNPEPLELGFVPKACPHLFLISRLPMQNVVTIIKREIALLNREVFATLIEARILIQDWREEYNQVRPHSALKYRTPTPESIMAMAQT